MSQFISLSSATLTSPRRTCTDTKVQQSAQCSVIDLAASTRRFSFSLNGEMGVDNTAQEANNSANDAQERKNIRKIIFSSRRDISGCNGRVKLGFGRKRRCQW